MVNCTIYWPSPTYCSSASAGYCDFDTGKCVCSSGYTSIGDFALIDGQDCDIHLVAVKALYAITLIAAIVCFAVSARYIYLKSRTIHLYENQKWSDPINLIPVSALICSIAFIIVSSCKIADPEFFAVGKSPLVTFFLGVTFYFFWAAQCFYLTVFSEMIMRQAKMKSMEYRQKVEDTIKRLRKLLRVLAFGNIIYGFSPMLLLALPQDVAVFAAIHYIGAAASICYLAYFVVPRVVSPIRDDIREAIKKFGIGEPGSSSKKDLSSSPRSGLSDERFASMDNAQKKLTILTGFVYRAGFQELILACIFGLWPFFLRKASYQLPITWFMGHGTLIFEVISISNFGKPKKQETSKVEQDSEKGVVTNIRGNQLSESGETSNRNIMTVSAVQSQSD